MTTPYRGPGLDLGGTKVSNAADGSAATDLATKGQLDNAIRGLSYKLPVLVATTANVALTGEQSIDGVTTSASRVLVQVNTAPAENGIWVTSSGAWTRAADMAAGASIPGSVVVTVQQGNTYQDTQRQLITDGTVVVGTTAQTWAVLGGGQTYTAGRGLALTAGQFAATGPLKYAAAVPAGATSTTINHGLATTDVQVTVFDVSGASPVAVLADVTVSSANAIVLGFATAPTTGQYRVVVIG